MRKRDEIADPNSCLNRALDDEWLFVFRWWVEERVKLGLNTRADAQIVEALRWADTVEAEQRGGMTVAEAREKRVCRVCGLKPDFGDAMPKDYAVMFDEMLKPVQFTFKYGKEFAHTECLKNNPRSI
ncbi:MAG: hypothetical protein GZ088_09610 [Acidipila sp.]|nr:hypothetical protein [Acidipila sp.]